MQLLNKIKNSYKLRRKLMAYLFILPSLTIFILFILYPIVYSFIMSFYDWNILSTEASYIGLDNYNNMSNDSRFWNALKNTFYFSFGFVPIGIIISLILALFVNRKIKGKNIFRTIYFLPVIAPMSIIAIIWTFLLNPDIGMISYYFSLIGLENTAWLRDPDLAMPAVIMVSIWKEMGFNMVVFLAGLQSIDESYYEAARIDGATKWEQFFYVTLPLLKSTTAFVVIMTVIKSLQVFDQVYVMTGGGPLFSTETLVQYIYKLGFVNFNMGYGSTVAYALFILLLFVTVIQLRYFKGEE